MSAELNELVNGGNTLLHYHLQDRIPTHDTLDQLHQVANVSVKTGDYTLTYNDDFVTADTPVAGITLTLPAANFGSEFHCTNSGVGRMTVVPTGSDTICDDTSVYTDVQWTSFNFKAVTGGWIII